jgi:hypothetical protein
MPRLCWIALTVAAVGLITAITLPAAWVTTASCWRPGLVARFNQFERI